ncbi:MAG: hypothetical protein EU536_03520 [Promethearchaeota archaeon]|nr:MAG: hypothetical protein EU536_03520 [Candidatus Lokiarchaeota archaeon]
MHENKLITRYELRMKIKELIHLQHFSDAEQQECEKLYEYPLLQFIFLSVTSGTPYSILAPILHEKREYKQMMFHYSHTFPLSDEALEEKYHAVCKQKLEHLQQIVSNLLLQAGYGILKSSDYQTLAKLAQTSLKIVLFCSILELANQIQELVLSSSDVFVIPPGTNINPFIQFYQQHSNAILLAEATVWLIDPETETISTFIGTPNGNLLQFFTKSELTRLIERHWRPTITEDF